MWCHRAGAAGRWSSELGRGPGARAPCRPCPVRPSCRGPGALAHNSAPAAAPPTTTPPRSRPRPPSPPRPQEPTSGGGGGGGGPRTRFPQTRGRVEEEADEHPPASADFVPSAPGPCGTDREGEAEAGREERRRRGRGAEAARPAAAAALLCAARAEEAEVGGGGSSASRSLRGSWRRRSAHPGPSGPGGRGAGCSGPGPGRCGDSSAPRRRPSSARPLAAAAAAASPAAGDMSNPGGRRNGPVKLRLTGEPGGRLRRRPWPGGGPGSRSLMRWKGMRAWEGLVQGVIGEPLKWGWEILPNAECGPWRSRGGRI